MRAEDQLVGRRVRKVPTYRGQPVHFVIDVRSRLEYWLGHLDGATCIPLDAISVQLRKRPEIKTNSRILVYCTSGARSAVAAKELRAFGYTHVIDAGAMSSAAHDFKS